MPPINWVFSCSVLFSNAPKKKEKEEEGIYSPIAKNRTILFSPFSLSLSLLFFFYERNKK
jgi:hypothetical protein